MSVKELKFYGTSGWDTDLEVSKDGDLIRIELTASDANCYYDLDRNQAHLLMLYLQEHLKEDISKELWRCSCGRWHPKDFVCERIGK